MKKLMLLGGICYLLPVIEATHKMGVHVITSGQSQEVGDSYVYSRQHDGMKQTLTVSHEVFDDNGMLVLERNSKKRESLVNLSEQPLIVDDGMPF